MRCSCWKDDRVSQHVGVVLGWIFSCNEQSAACNLLWTPDIIYAQEQTSHTDATAKSTIHLMETSQREGRLHTATHIASTALRSKANRLGGGAECFFFICEGLKICFNKRCMSNYETLKRIECPTDDNKLSAVSLFLEAPDQETGSPLVHCDAGSCCFSFVPTPLHWDWLYSLKKKFQHPMLIFPVNAYSMFPSFQETFLQLPGTIYLKRCWKTVNSH